MSDKKWYPVQYAHVWEVQEGEFYGDKRVLWIEDVGESQAEYNAKLAASAPELARKVKELEKSVAQWKELADKLFYRNPGFRGSRKQK